MTIPVDIEGVGRVHFPDGYSPERIRFAIEKDILPRLAEKPPSTRSPEEVMWRQQIRRESAPSRLERTGRGVADVTQGIAQGGLMLKDIIAGTSDADAYTADKTEEVKRYESLRNDGGLDIARLGGNIGMTAPAALIPGGASASLAARMASGGVGGAVASGSMFTPEGDSKLAQTAVGTLFGVSTPAVMQGVRSAGGRVFDLMRPQVNVNLPAQSGRLAGELEIKLQQQGVDWKSLGSDIQSSLLRDAERTLNTGGTLNDFMLANKAVIESIGAKPTRAAVTRAPRDWQEEKNLRGIRGVGDDIVGREQTNAQAMIDYLQKIRSGTGGKSSTALEAGESAITALKSSDAEKKKVVDELYQAFRDSGAKDVNIPERRLTDTLSKIIDEVGLDNIPPAVQSRLKDFGFLGGKRTRDLTVQQADLFNRLLNANNPGNGPASKTIGMLREALNDTLIEMPAAGEKLLVARESAAKRFAEIKSGKGITAALDDATPDRFVKRFVVDADVQDLRAMIGELGKSSAGKQAVQDVKGHLLDNLLLKATGATNIDDLAGKRFSGVAFGKALDAIPPEKLHLIFKPEELSSLRQLQKASKLLTEEVPFSDVNHSRTTAALANLLLKVGETPFVGKLVSPIIGTGKIGLDWVQNASQRKQVAEILLGSSATSGQRQALPPAKLEKLLPAGVGAAAAGVSTQAD